MSILRSARWLLLALVVTLIPATSHAGVFISVGFAPPPLPVYVQPDCPQPGLMWTPGYWAYDYDQGSYYWVDGQWVPAPFPGALWTPGYWGWQDGVFVFHDGYWGDQVGYYGGVDYGYGYGGIGFAGGEWRSGRFFYNTAVMHVDRRYIHSTFDDRGRVDRGFAARDSHVAFSGGPGGIRYQPNAQERMAEHEHHTAATSFQTQHQSMARSNKSSYRGGETRENPSIHHEGMSPSGMNGGHAQAAPTRGKPAQDDWQAPTRMNSEAGSSHPSAEHGSTPRPQEHSQPQSRPQSHPQSHAAPQSHPAHGNSAPKEGHEEGHERK